MNDKRFHINEKDEIKPCKAKEIKDCPVKNSNGEKTQHYQTIEQALKYREEKLSKKYKKTQSLSKKLFSPKILKNSYIGAPVENSLMGKFEKDLKNSHIENIDVFMENRKNRDNGEYHITLITPPEFRKLKKAGKFIDLDKVDSFHIDFVGVGTVEDIENDKQAWFVVGKSDEVNSWRNKLGLPYKDLHITLAFRNGDVFNFRKNENTLI